MVVCKPRALVSLLPGERGGPERQDAGGSGGSAQEHAHGRHRQPRGASTRGRLPPSRSGEMSFSFSKHRVLNPGPGKSALHHEYTHTHTHPSPRRISNKPVVLSHMFICLWPNFLNMRIL